MQSDITISRGDIWEVRFDPAEGDEIQKVRPALVVSVASSGRMQLRIVVPLTGWQPQFERFFWMVKIIPSSKNGLRKVSATDCFQVKSISMNRFQRKLGILGDPELNQITAAVALCIGYSP
jgi:mRNA interferase MazF